MPLADPSRTKARWCKGGGGGRVKVEPRGLKVGGGRRGDHQVRLITLPGQAKTLKSSFGSGF
jgi:hypothetical protein